jgi:hypothetical protein
MLTRPLEDALHVRPETSLSPVVSRGHLCAPRLTVARRVQQRFGGGRVKVWIIAAG